MQPPLLFDPRPWQHAVYDKLTRDEQDGLYAYLWAIRTQYNTTILSAFPTSDNAFTAEEFRPIELAAMASTTGLLTADDVRAVLRLGTVLLTPPTKSKIDSVIQSAKQVLWLNLI